MKRQLINIKNNNIFSLKKKSKLLEFLKILNKVKNKKYFYKLQKNEKNSDKL